MIELVSTDRCIKCDACVDACPDNVFDSVPGEVPVIARIETVRRVSYANSIARPTRCTFLRSRRSASELTKRP